MIENRSDENRRAMLCFDSLHRVLSPAFSVLRQELDSMIRVIYLLQVTDHVERKRLIQSTMNGEEWTVSTVKGKRRKITDREMVNIANNLEGWTKSVYKFGCAFIHLSNFHNYLVLDPFQKLSPEDKKDILSHMRYYHGGPSNEDPDIEEISVYLPRVFEKISDNLRCYIDELRSE